MAAQDARRVRVYRRGDDGRWLDAETFAHGDHFELPTLREPIAVADAYDDILDDDGHSLLR